jgi:hypothetical protein
MSDSKNKFQFTPEQRFHLDIDGYVVIQGFILSAQTSALREELYDAERRFRRDGSKPASPSFLSGTTANNFRVDNLPHLAPCFHEYLSDPRLVGRVEEMIGHEPRLEQSDAHIRRPEAGKEDKYGFHRATRLGFGSVERNGLYHFPFVKALTNLTDLEKDDGGTSVITGSHKIPGHLDPVLIEAALRDPTLVKQVIAPAGSTLFFYESLLHSSGINRSGKDRLLILGGYTPTLFQPQHDEHPNQDFLKSLDEKSQNLYSGRQAWEGGERHRYLV